MATVTKVDELSKEERALVVMALKLQIASCERAKRAAASPVLIEAQEVVTQQFRNVLAKFS